LAIPIECFGRAGVSPDTENVIGMNLPWPSSRRAGSTVTALGSRRCFRSTRGSSTGSHSDGRQSEDSARRSRLAKRRPPPAQPPQGEDLLFLVVSQDVGHAGGMSTLTPAASTSWGVAYVTGRFQLSTTGRFWVSTEAATASVQRMVGGKVLFAFGAVRPPTDMNPVRPTGHRSRASHPKGRMERNGAPRGEGRLQRGPC